MRTLSVAVMTGHGSGQKLPREGSRLRQLYDVLQTARGLPIVLDASQLGYKNANGMMTSLIQLINFYGLDVRHLHCNGKPGKYRSGLAAGTYVLAGEYIDGRYVDYIAERINTGNRTNA